MIACIIPAIDTINGNPKQLGNGPPEHIFCSRRVYDATKELHFPPPSSADYRATCAQGERSPFDQVETSVLDYISNDLLLK